jgi:hypothetical protein
MRSALPSANSWVEWLRICSLKRMRVVLPAARNGVKDSQNSTAKRHKSRGKDNRR